MQRFSSSLVMIVACNDINHNEPADMAVSYFEIAEGTIEIYNPPIISQEDPVIFIADIE